MSDVLIISYSQSGEVARVVEAFSEGLRSGGARVTLARIEPQQAYPYPWRSIRRFFDVMPYCQLGKPPPTSLSTFEGPQTFDLVVLAYPVWFLSPALPVQGFLRSPEATILRGANVLTISVSRAMWHQASETMKLLLVAVGARHVGNIVATHAGSTVTTLVSTPRTLLSGKRDRLMGVFPEAGVAAADIARVRGLGSVVAARLSASPPVRTGLLADEPAVSVRRRFVVPELLAWYFFHGSAVVIDRLGRLGRFFRAVGVYGFAILLVTLILVALPLILLGTWLLQPLIRQPLDRYIEKLLSPGGTSNNA